MIMQRRQKTIQLSDGRQITVHEANWDIATEKSALETRAREEKEKQNGSGDPDVLFFMEIIHPALASASTGDVPTLQQAVNLPDDDLDDWFFAVRELNPDWFTAYEDIEEDVSFRDGSVLAVQSIKRPSVLMRLQKLERQTDNNVSSDVPAREVFRVLYYPKMAACSAGVVPTLEQAFDYPESELNKWYSAVRRVNPSLFVPLEEIAQKNLQAADDKEKKRRKPRKRS